MARPIYTARYTQIISNKIQEKKNKEHLKAFQMDTHDLPILNSMFVKYLWTGTEQQSIFFLILY